VADVAVQLLQHFAVQLFLAVEVVIDHPFGGLRALGDGIDSCARQSLGNELGDGGLKDAIAGLFRVVLAALAWRLYGRFEQSLIDSFHAWLTTTGNRAIMSRGAPLRKRHMPAFHQSFTNTPLCDLRADERG